MIPTIRAKVVSLALLMAVLVSAFGLAGLHPRGAEAALTGSKTVNGCTLTVVNPSYAGSAKLVGYGLINCGSVKKNLSLTVYLQRWNESLGRWQGYGSVTVSGYGTYIGYLPVYGTCYPGWYRTTAVTYVNGVGGSTANQAEYYRFC